MKSQPVKQRRGKKAWVLAALAALVIFGFSAHPHSAEFTGKIFGEYNGMARHAAHMTEFAVFFVVLRWALGTTLRFPGVALSVVSFLACGAYACVDEWHQSFVPGRTSSVNDVLLDLKGAAIGVAIWYALCGLKVLQKRPY